MERLLISFSGGETSAYMTWWLLRNAARLGYQSVAVVFANTGEEWEETLEFIRDCDERMSFGTVWIEGMQFQGQRKNPTYRVVDFSSASRDGGPFEDHIRKYGIPNTKYRDCTRQLKRRPIEAYACDGLGWEDGSYDLAVGIRADEMDRVSSEAEARRLFYPFAFLAPRTKPQVNTWWSLQNFRLRLKGYQGNCKWCWKKNIRKHLTLIHESPEIYEFPRRMERDYSHVGPEFTKTTSIKPLPVNYRRTFFRGSVTVDDMFLQYAEKRNAGTLRLSTDDHQVFDPDSDVGDGCEESCEVFGPDDYDRDEDA